MRLRVVMIITALVGVAGILVVEGFALGNDVSGDTLSEVVADATDVTRALPFALGALLGHFASRRELQVSGKTRMFMALSLIPGAVLAHLIGGPAWVVAAAGLLAGWSLWPLSK